ncbi:MAG: sigma-70 family RNA polymerase sigma factor [Bacilli bacterium]|nr:sigma-70 family RNA polymerase sigma factor [Bacilli bacterium]
MNRYEDLNDYELVSIAQELNEDAINLLHEKYQPLIKKKSCKYMKYLRNKGIELSDLIQECTIGFEEAIHNFNPNDDVSFYTFANVCMDRQLMSELTKQNRAKYKFLNEAIPLETLEDDSDINLIDFIKDNSGNPELGLLSNEEFKELYANISKELTALEECVFKLKIQGFGYKEIADILDKDDKSIDNAIQRIKIKIKSIMN